MQPMIRPNFKKIFLLNFLKVTIGFVGLILALLFFNSFVGLDIFMVILKEFGMEIDITPLIFYFIGFFIFGYVALLALNFFLLSSIRYEFLQDKLVCYTTLFFILLGSKDIPYKNIARISFESGGFVNSLLNTGNVILDLSAMKEKTFKIECVDNPEQVAQYIQKMIRYYNSRYYAQRAKDYRLDEIMGKEGL